MPSEWTAHRVVCATPRCVLEAECQQTWLGTFCYRHRSLLGGFNFVESSCGCGGEGWEYGEENQTLRLGVRNWEEEGDKFRDSLPSDGHFQMPAPALGLRCGSEGQTSLLPLGDLARSRSR